MADKEISALATSTTLNPTDYFHIKQGSTDVKMTIGTILTAHTALTNPHGTTKSDVGLGAVLNVAQLEKAQNLDDLPNKTTARSNLGVYSIAEANTAINLHANKTNNPHNVTKAQVGLSNVNNWPASNAVNNDSSTTYATALAVKTVQDNLNQYTNLPKGAIVMWSQNAGAIPVGFALCNGQTIGGIVTPNLVGLFIKGSTVEDTNTTGGSSTITHTHAGSATGHSLTINEMPAHRHHSGTRTTQKGLRGASGSEETSPDVNFTDTNGYTEIVGGNGVGIGVSDPHSHNLNISDTTTSNEPQFYNLAFIMKYI